MRKTDIIIVGLVAGEFKFHFCSKELRGDDKWYPITHKNEIPSPDELFHSVEQTLISLGAHNLTSLDLRRQNHENSWDYSVTYNVADERTYKFIVHSGAKRREHGIRAASYDLAIKILESRIPSSAIWRAV